MWDLPMQSAQRQGVPKVGKKGPFLKVKSGSAMVPIYRTETKGRVRYMLSFYRDERRMRKVFTSLDCA